MELHFLFLSNYDRRRLLYFLLSRCIVPECHTYAKKQQMWISGFSQSQCTNPHFREECPRRAALEGDIHQSLCWSAIEPGTGNTGNIFLTTSGKKNLCFNSVSEWEYIFLAGSTCRDKCKVNWILLDCWMRKSYEREGTSLQASCILLGWGRGRWWLLQLTQHKPCSRCLLLWVTTQCTA